MVMPWRRRSAGRGGNKKGEILSDNLTQVEFQIPTHFRCPISLDLMKDPVTLSTGITYDRDSIEKWIEAGNQTCPITNQVLQSFDLIPNHSIRKMIQEWCVQNRSFGIERIPTPRIPVSRVEVSQLCENISIATQRGDEIKCLELVGKIKSWGKDSERNKRSIVENGTGVFISACFEAFASISMEKYEELLDQILSILSWMFPLGVEGQSNLGSASSLKCLVWFLQSTDLSARQNAAMVIKELLSLNQNHTKNLMEIEGAVKALVRIIKEPIGPKATKASLTVIFRIISTSTATDMKIVASFVELGLVSLLMETLIDGENSICERALVVLDSLCDYREGREKAYENALTVPLLVKKMLRISDLATELLVSILWKLFKNDERDIEGSVLVEALQVGAFQKLLVMLQVGCNERMKEKVTELLKLLNLQRGRLDCTDSSMNFKYIKRPF